MNYVIDACALIAWLRDETGSEFVSSLIFNPDNNCYVHAINLIEVEYDFIRNDGQEIAQEVMRDINNSPLSINRTLNKNLTMRIAQIKSRGRISIADSICLAFAEEKNATVVTSDHHEFDRLTDEHTILFIR